MAVPKKKTSKQKRDTRRAHDALRRSNIAFDAKTGEAKLPHHMSLKDGFYKGRQVVIPSEVKKVTDEDQSV